MKIPLLDLGAQLSPLREEILSAVTSVLDSTCYIQGPEVLSLEEEVAAYCGAKSAVGVSSGTDALLVSLMALGIGPGDKVLTTPYSFFATMGVVLRLGAEPVFCDIDPVSYNMDPDKMSSILTADSKKKIKAIIPVHLYGQCADMGSIMEVADNYSIPVVEDAAQAIGAEYPSQEGEWKKSGTMGICGCFSFFPSKNLGGIGDGGMVVSNDKYFAEKVRILRNHGAQPKYYHAEIGGNFRLDPIQAAVLRVKLRHLESWHAARRKNADYYSNLFSTFTPGERGEVITPIAVYKDQAQKSEGKSNYHIYNQYVIEVKRRDDLIAHLREQNIGCEIYYPLCLHKQQCVAGKIKKVTMPHAENAAKRTIALPIYPEITQEMQEYVVKQIETFFV
ncbi:MAG: transcriptional regulator [Desulfocapsa sp.]|nr:MAG: transcriptional regulator [Desulfocapsa sp.]